MIDIKGEESHILRHAKPQFLDGTGDADSDGVVLANDGPGNLIASCSRSI